MRTKDDLIHYRREGRGAPLVLVHGVGANLRSWDRVAEVLSQDFDILRLDLRGHGDSAVIDGEYSIDAFAADVIRMMDEAGVERAHLAGFSLGGLIAQRLAHGWPDRFDRVVILSAVAGRTDQEREKVVSRLQMIREGGIEAITGAAQDRWFTEDFAKRNPEVIERRIAELKAVDLPSYLEAYRVFGTTELVDTLHEIAAPTLVMTGECDVGSNVRMAETMHRLIPGSELRILPGLKHSVLVEASDQLAGYIGEFLKRDSEGNQGMANG
ncbi:3-oxoadipate enol-lactonase [Roseovarius pacificus]|uniref:3-oxoadipate enol-lactonase n=1 Tax=Roseovarius pacificus TaxID=337701 RepID=A0A1M7A0T1_9RHOB|nr:alpha/beta hydrolase [Roseovarius pacificus]GGO54018.1 3-oxoadipate enol-lactone hydrolase [Roseovarius pacificus]SHL36324.1 3-oxoadipate enol-lactonase [Roseovarius pacificus]